MSSINRRAIEALERNPIKVYIEGVIIILRLLDNVIREPDNSKYRTIRMTNKIIAEKILSLNNIKPVLECLGFEQVGEELRLSLNMLIADLKKYRDFLRERLEIVKKQQNSVSNQLITDDNDSVNNKSTNAMETESNPSRSGAIKKDRKNDYCQIRPMKTFTERTAFPSVLNTQNQFLRSLESRSDEVLQYEDENLKAYGRQLIPIERLTQNALNRMRQIQKVILSNDKSVTEPCFSDILLTELTNWFNTEFFTWINSLPCRRCGNENIQTKGSYVDQGIRVETYTCCNETSKFYRFNDIETLLKTRRGRCGEYANCFTFLCRCLGFDARFVLATFDHVWTEVYSVSQRRWIHVDPSDNVLDAPLMYEHGWKRNIDYIIAFSKDDIQDVTWRYTNSHKKILTKRKKCTEDELLKTIECLREKRRINCSSARKKYLVKRTLMELFELITEKPVTENERKGRSSGSLDWKLSRGEQNSNNFYIFNSLPSEIVAKQFNLRYSCTKNVYERFIEENGSTTILDSSDQWESWHYTSSNIFRKVERDWKMVYLARVEDSPNASIVWNFNFGNDLRIKNVSLKFETKTYENGIINVEFVNGKNVSNSVTALQGQSAFRLRITLSGGKGDVAWQHTQLFRQRLGSNDFPFELKIEFY